MIARDFFYAIPQGAYLLFGVVIILSLYASLALYRKKTLENLASGSVINVILHKRPPFNFVRKVFFVTGTWILATLALMDPQGNARYPEALKKEATPEEALALKRRAHEVIFMIDDSASMSVEDMRTGQSRLDYAKEISDEIARRLNGETMAVYTFTSESNMIVPSTLDTIYSRLLMRDIDVNEGGVAGTNIVRSLKQVLEDFSAKSDETLKTLILISDGEDVSDDKLTEGERSARRQQLVDLIENQKNLQIFTIGVGTIQGGTVPNITYQGKAVHSSLDDSFLKVLAEDGRGRYLDGNRLNTLSIAKTVIDTMKPESPYLDSYEAHTSTYLSRQGDDYIYDRYYQYPLALAILLLAAFLIFPENWKREREQ